MNEQTHLSQVLTILIQAAEVAQSKGAFVLVEAGIVAQAVEAAKKLIEEDSKPKADEPTLEVVKEAKPKKQTK